MTLVRCADCRRICTCSIECTCGALTAEGDHLCHVCTDVRAAAPTDPGPVHAAPVTAATDRVTVLPHEEQSA